MHTLRIQHAVTDFDRWKELFDSDPADRKGSGVQSYRIMRVASDPSRVLIDLDFDSLDQAEAMHEKLRGIWAGPAKAVTLDPTAQVVQTVEQRDL